MILIIKTLNNKINYKILKMMNLNKKKFKFKTKIH